MKTLLLWLICISGSLYMTAQEPIDTWMHARRARGKIEVISRDAASMQQLALWAERSLKELETDWGSRIPFQKGQNFTFIIDPTASRIQYRQVWQRNVLKQTLRLPETALVENPQELAEIFTRAMAYRMGIAAMSSERNNRNWQVPDWVVKGSAHTLLSGRTPALFSIAVREFSTTSPPYPEQVTKDLPESTSLQNEVAAALLCRWIFEHNVPDFWRCLGEGQFRTPEGWTTFFPTVGTFRELHIQWDVWWRADREKLIADYSLEEAAEMQLQRELIFIPAFYGLYIEGEDRYTSMFFPTLEAYLDDPHFIMAIREWSLRLQRLRFRQRPEFNKQVEQLQEAGLLAIRAAKTKGRKRERLWEEAVATFSSE